MSSLVRTSAAPLAVLAAACSVVSSFDGLTENRHGAAGSSAEGAGAGTGMGAGAGTATGGASDGGAAGAAGDGSGGAAAGATGGTSGSGGAGCTGTQKRCGGHGVAGEASSLFYCDGTLFQTCPNGCIAAASGGDSCSPCSAGKQYCGDHGPESDAEKLFTCDNEGRFTELKTCPYYCGNVPGSGDECVRCIASGTYCGGDKLPGDPDTLYVCSSGGKATLPTKCAKGCEILPEGQDDQCYL